MLSGIAAHCDPSISRDWVTKCRVSPEIHMPGRTAKFVSAIFVSILAGIPLATVSHGATPAADDCLSGPKDPAPNGSHWYYRIDHATKRHCWYLKGEQFSQSAAANSSPSAKTASPTAEATTQRSIADAHAELPAQTAIETPKRSDGLALAIAADTTVATSAAETQRSAIASRWPEQTGTSSSTVPPSTAANSDAAAPSDPDATPSSAPAAITLAAADSSPEKQPGSIQTLLLVILGALALAGLIGSAVFRFGNLRWTGRRTIQIDRQSLWETDRRSPPVEFDPGARIGRDDIPWELRTADDPNGRVQEMLARLARSATI
jgi:hypothetical protein